MLPLGRSHRADDNLGLLEDVVRDVHIAHYLVHTGNHTHQVLHRAHLLNLANLLHKVVEVELVFVDFLLEPALLLFAVLLLCPLHKRHHIAHTEDTVGHTLGVEYLQRIHLLARGDELQGLIDNRANGNGRTTTGVAIQLGQYHAIKVQSLVKFTCGVHGILTRHRVHHKEGFGGFHSPLHSLNLLHHLLVYGKATGGIDNHRVDVLAAGIFDGVLGNLHRVHIALLGVDLHAHLLAQDFELVDGCGAVDIACHEQHAAALFALELEGEFTGEGGLTGALQTCNQDNGRVAREVDVGGGAAHKCGQLITHNLGHHLTGLHGGEHVGTESLLLNLIGKGLGDLVVHIGINQRTANLFESFGHVNLGNLTLTLEYLE